MAGGCCSARPSDTPGSSSSSHNAFGTTAIHRWWSTRRTSLPFRSYKDFEYQTLDSWSRTRRVVGKAEYLIDKPNARFVVTSLSIEAYAGQTLYETEYCGRG